jgi:hypothetical protein
LRNLKEKCQSLSINNKQTKFYCSKSSPISDNTKTKKWISQFLILLSFTTEFFKQITLRTEWKDVRKEIIFSISLFQHCKNCFKILHQHFNQGKNKSNYW